MAEFDTVAIVGVGLIGGSIGLAVRERKLARQVIGIGRDEAKLANACRLGAIDAGTTVVGQRRRRGPAGRSFARRSTRSPILWARPAAVVGQSHADHRRRQHEGRASSERRSCCWSIAAMGRGSSAAIRWPAIIARASSCPRRFVRRSQSGGDADRAVAPGRRAWRSAGSGRAWGPRS